MYHTVKVYQRPQPNGRMLLAPQSHISTKAVGSVHVVLRDDTAASVAMLEAEQVPEEMLGVQLLELWDSWAGVWLKRQAHVAHHTIVAVHSLSSCCCGLICIYVSSYVRT